MKILSVVGARPQFIKHAPLSQELMKSHHMVLVHTGQHYDYNMNKVFFDELGIPAPDYNLGIGSGSHAYQTGEMMKGIEDVLNKEKPDLVLIYGDTNSTLAAALTASKMRFKIAHVEAGLRNFDKSIPEEINRTTADICSDSLFCPTRTAVDNLRAENIINGVYLTGDVMVDVMNAHREIAAKSDILEKLDLSPRNYILVTVHRAGNTDNRQNLESIARALIELGKSGETLVFPAHPRTVKLLSNYGLIDELKTAARIIEPLGYLEFMKLMDQAKKIATDSGGIQKEAYILKVPCITMMESTSWVETLEEGWNILSGMNTDNIVKCIREFQPGNRYSNIFGEGACRKIAEIIQGN